MSGQRTTAKHGLRGPGRPREDDRGADRWVQPATTRVLDIDVPDELRALFADDVQPPRKRQRSPRSAEERARETARRAELRKDPAYRCHQELLRRQRLRRNKSQLATVG